jgi:peptide/nickel transport system substrate-binding protein
MRKDDKTGLASRGALLLALGLVAVLSPAPAAAEHAIAMHGRPAWPASFSAPSYANPDAPKGGRLSIGVLGTFDSVNPFVVRGLAAHSIRGYVVESLLARGYDEPFTLYGLLARSVETDAERSFVTFTLDPAAHFSDGRPVTADDVVFSWQLLRDHGRPNLRAYYSKVKAAEILPGPAVRFTFTEVDRELPLILGLMPVLPKHAIDPATFEETTFTPLIGSGPYIVAEVEAGRHVTFRRDPNYWGRDRPINRGLWNFDEIRFDYYRDANASFEAFKRGLIDIRVETDPGRWLTGYDGAASREGRIVKDTFVSGQPKPMPAFVFNTRRSVFADIRVRQAIALLFDFDWINRSLFYGMYRRSQSYFEGSELSSAGRPASARERALLAPFPDAVRPDVMEGKWAPPKSDGTGRDRETLKKALALLDAAGYGLDGTELRERSSGKPLTFEILVATRDQERLALAFTRDLRRAGINVSVRSVDAVQYDRRLLTFDFDMIQYQWDQSLSPGNEQNFYFSAVAADTEGSRNYMGVQSPAIDAMIAAMLQARERDDLVAATRALDRLLVSGSYVIPLFHLPEQWVARWSHIRRPAKTSLFGYLPETWWYNKPTN